MFKIKNIIKNKNGFGLIEMVMAMTILSIALVGLLNLMTHIMASSRYNQEKIIALNFAREGVEIIRNVRDSNWLRACPTWGGSCTHWTLIGGTDDCCVWDSGLDSDSDHTLALEYDPTTNNYVLNYTANDFTSELTKIYEDQSTGIFSSSTYLTNANYTGYQRLITIDYICRDSDGTNEQIVTVGGCVGQDKVGIRVTSTVKWDNASKSVSLVDKLYNWK